MANAIGYIADYLTALFDGTNAVEHVETMAALRGSVGVANPSQMARTRVALGNVMAKKGRAIIELNGDSNTFGYLSEALSGTSASLKTHSPAAFLASIFKLPSRCETVSGNGNADYTSLGIYDPTLVVAAAWQNTSFPTLGGQAFNGTGAAGAWAKTPLDAWNTADVYTRGAGAFSISNGTVVQNVSPTSGPLVKTTYSTGSAAAIQTLSIAQTGGVGQAILRVDCYDSANPKVNFSLSGGIGNTTSRLTESATYSTVPVLQAVAPHCVFFCYGLNDWNTALPISTFTSNYQAGITGMLSISDVGLVVPSPPGGSPGTAGGPAWTEFVAAIYALGKANNIPVVDYTARMVDWATSNALGQRNGPLHNTATGYADNAMALDNFLTGII
jgi:hypothetical protein